MYQSDVNLIDCSISILLDQLIYFFILFEFIFNSFVSTYFFVVLNLIFLFDKLFNFSINFITVIFFLFFGETFHDISFLSLHLLKNFSIKQI